ncbi:MAG TPA: flagellar motor protein MotB [Polyangiaceae bacterium]|nr:flagellar motor protein MotB [Polyangiaceae bacterium]
MKGGHGGHHGGAWKVAYADFVTAMMALFMVLWLVSQTDQSTREKLSQYFRTGVLSGSTSVLNGGTGVEDKGYLDVKGANGEDEETKLNDAAQKIREALKQLRAKDADFAALGGQIKVSVTDFGLLIQIMDGGQDTIFDVSSADLKPALVNVLTKLAPMLAKLDNQIQVHGHTDARPFPTGSTRSNWSLSFERADKARAVLEKSGIRPGQITGVFAHAENAPVVKDAKDSVNRRLAIMAVRRGFEAALAYGQLKDPVM